jgi:hypothetical protein
MALTVVAQMRDQGAQSKKVAAPKKSKVRSTSHSIAHVCYSSQKIPVIEEEPPKESESPGADTDPGSSGLSIRCMCCWGGSDHVPVAWDQRSRVPLHVLCSRVPVLYSSACSWAPLLCSCALLVCMSCAPLPVLCSSAVRSSACAPLPVLCSSTCPYFLYSSLFPLPAPGLRCLPPRLCSCACSFAPLPLLPSGSFVCVPPADASS